MKRVMKSMAVLALVTTALTAQAASDFQKGCSDKRSCQRIEVMDQYFKNMERGSADGMDQIFITNGEVASTSSGVVDASTFYHSFLPGIVEGRVTAGEPMQGIRNKNKWAVRFHFSYTMEDGSTGSGDYIDEFVFSPKTNLLRSVYMFENDKIS